MAQRQGELSCSEVARLLEISTKSARRWAKACVFGTDRTRFRAGSVRIDAKGQYWIQVVEAHRILREECGPAPTKLRQLFWTRDDPLGDIR